MTGLVGRSRLGTHPSRSINPSRYLCVVAIFHSHQGELTPSATTNAKL